VTSKARLQSLAYTSSPMTFYGLPLDYSLPTRFSFLHSVRLLIKVNTIWLILGLGNECVSAEDSKALNVMGKPLLVESREGSDRGFCLEISQRLRCGTEKTLGTSGSLVSCMSLWWEPSESKCSFFGVAVLAILCNAVVLWSVVGLQFTVRSNSSLHHTRLGYQVQIS